MSELTWEKFREEYLELSEKEFHDLGPAKNANLKGTRSDKVCKQKEHKACMQQL